MITLGKKIKHPLKRKREKERVEPLNLRFF
jgi:hypothetical protein